MPSRATYSNREQRTPNDYRNVDTLKISNYRDGAVHVRLMPYQQKLRPTDPDRYQHHMMSNARVSQARGSTDKKCIHRLQQAQGISHTSTNDMRSVAFNIETI